MHGMGGLFERAARVRMRCETIVPLAIKPAQAMAPFYFDTENTLCGNNDDEINFSGNLFPVTGYVQGMECDPIAGDRIIPQTEEDFTFTFTASTAMGNRGNHFRHQDSLTFAGRPMRDAGTVETSGALCSILQAVRLPPSAPA